MIWTWKDLFPKLAVGLTFPNSLLASQKVQGFWNSKSGVSRTISGRRWPCMMQGTRCIALSEVFFSLHVSIYLPRYLDTYICRPWVTRDSCNCEGSI